RCDPGGAKRKERSMTDQMLDANRTDRLSQLEPDEVMALYRAGAISRRDIFRLLGALGLTAFGASMLDRGALAADELKLIIWEGYADDKYRVPFEQANNATVSATAATTGDEMFSLMNESEGRNYDVVSA